MSALRDKALIGVLALGLTLVLGAQAAADALVPEASGTQTTEAVGRAASSYLTGIKTFAAAVVWNRLEPVMHGYYSGVSLGEQRYMLSSLALVMALDPQQTQAYPIGSWILADNDRVADALKVAERGVETNPRSGLTLSNLAQMQYLYGDGLSVAAVTAERALGEDVEWMDAQQKHQWYPVLGDILRRAGRDDLDATVQAELERLDAEHADELGDAGHDHDHDGVPDH